MDSSIYISLYTSIVIQIVTEVVQVLALFINVSPKFSFLKQMMWLEVIVQNVEGLFYLYWLFNFNDILNITPIRYFDWVITTPTMLVNLICYLIFLDHKEKNTSDTLTLFTILKKEFSTIVTVLLLNWAMLFFGYLGETSVIPTLFAISLGFIPFIIYYYIIYTNYARFSKDGMQIYAYFLFFWSLYGVAAVSPYNIKTVSYNILDLFSKNFFGIFLTYLLLTNNNDASLRFLQ
uniref:Uncharacterized protein n=1 Tax=viral metagenome TaxID=1070528 RepID=A0A6C0I3A0_9ZZZZ